MSKVEDQNEVTTIKLKILTRNNLAALGSKDDSFDDIVARLIKERKKK